MLTGPQAENAHIQHAVVSLYSEVIAMRLWLLILTCLLAVGISISMWAFGLVPFTFHIFALHIASIYIGIALVLLFERKFKV